MSDRLEISGAARQAAQPPAASNVDLTARLQTATAYGAPPAQLVPAGRAQEPAEGWPPDASPIVMSEIRGLRDEIARLRESLQAPATTATGRNVDWPDLPRPARALLHRLRTGGASESFLARTAIAVRDALTATPGGASGATSDAARAAVLRAVLSLLPNGTATPLPHGANASTFLIGPSGAGKTLSAAKLAWSIRQRGEQVVLANADQKRPGAGAQLAAYGEALDIPTAQIYEAADLRSLVDANPNAALVIDTAGGLPDEHELLALRGLTQATASTAQVLLTVAAGSGAAESRRAAEIFAALSPAGLIISKADEAQSFLEPLQSAGPATLLERVLQHGREGAHDDALAS